MLYFTLNYFSDSDYGKKKKKKGGVKGKQKRLPVPRKFLGNKASKRRGGGGGWSDDSDSDRPRKKKRKALPSAELDRSNIVDSSRGRRTRGVKVNYSLLEGSSDEDKEQAKGKGKGPRKWDGSEDEFKPESDTDKKEEDAVEEEASEDGEEEEEVASEDLPESGSEEEKPQSSKSITKKKTESDDDDESSKGSNNPDISDEESDDDDEPQAKPVKPVKKPAPKNSPGKIKLMSNTASPFPKAPPPVEGEEDSDDGFQSPATPSEDEDDE